MQRIAFEKKGTGSKIPRRPPLVNTTFPNFEYGGIDFDVVQVKPLQCFFIRAGQVAFVQMHAPLPILQNEQAKINHPIQVHAAAALVISSSAMKTESVQFDRSMRLENPCMNDSMIRRIGFTLDGERPQGPDKREALLDAEVTHGGFMIFDIEQISLHNRLLRCELISAQDLSFLQLHDPDLID